MGHHGHPISNRAKPRFLITSIRASEKTKPDRVGEL